MVEIRREGQVFVTTLERWADKQGMDAAQARQPLQQLADDAPGAGQTAAIWLVNAIRKKGAGNPTYRLQLPGPARWALLHGAGVHQLTAGSVRQLQVLVRSYEDGMELLGTPSDVEFTTGDLTFYDGTSLP